MATGTGLDRFQKRFPARFFDVGICESHAVAFAADSQTTTQLVQDLMGIGVHSLYIAQGVTAGELAMLARYLWDVKDAAGKLFVQDQVKQMQAGASGSVQMRWMNPATKQIDDAEALIGRVPGQEVYVGAVWFK